MESHLTKTEDIKLTSSAPIRHMYDQSGTLFLNGVQLEAIRSIGFSQNQQQLHWIQHNKLAYLCGSTIVIYNIVTGHQSLIPLSQQNIKIFKAFKNAYNEDILIIIHQSQNNPLVLSTFNSWKNKKQRIPLQTLQKSEQIIDITYLIQSNQLVLLSIDSVNVTKITRIDLKKDKPKVSTLIMQQKIIGIFHQNKASSSSFYYYTSKKIFKCKFDIYEMDENLMQIQLYQQQNIMCCSLISIDSNNTLIYATSYNNMYICNQIDNKIEKIEVQHLGDLELVDNKGNRHKQERRPTNICGNDIFIFVGYQKSASITCFKVSNLSFLKRNKQQIDMDCEDTVKVISMNINSEQATLVILVETSDGQESQKPTKIKNKSQIENQNSNSKRVFPILFNYLLHQTINIHTKSPFNKIFDQTVSHKAVVDISVCCLKKQVLVLTADRKIRAYDLQMPENLPLSRLYLWQYEFPQKTLSFSVHPINQNIAVAFKDEIKLYSFGFESLRYMNLSHPQKSQIIRYSKQGHYLAAIHLNSSIMLFNSYSFQITHVFNYNNITIKQFEFVGSDQYLVLKGKNGHVLLVTIQGKRVIQNYNRLMKVNACVYDPAYDILIVSYKECVTKIYTQKGRNQVGIIYTSNFYFSCFLLSSDYNTLFAGTSKGCIRIYQWPVTSFSTFEKSFIEYKLHSSSVNFISLSLDFRYLISCSQDGSTVISRIKHYSNGFGTSQFEINQIFNIQQKNNLINQFQSIIVNSNYQNRHQDEIIMRLEDDKMIHKQSTDGDMGKLKRYYDKKFISVQSQKKDEKNKISQKYNNQIYMYEQLKMQTQIKREGVELKTKQLQIIKQQFLQKLRKLYEIKKSLQTAKQKLQNKYNQQLNVNIEDNQHLNIIQSNQIASHLSTKRKNYNKTRTSKQLMQRQLHESAGQHQQQEVIQKTQIINKYKQKYEKFKKSSQKLQKQNRFLQSSISVLKQRNSKGVILKQNIEQKLQKLVNQQKQRDVCIMNATNQLKKRDQIISQQQEKSKKMLKFNIYQANHEGCLKYRLQQLQEECSVLKIDFHKLQDEKKKAYIKLVDEAQNKKQFNSNIEIAKKKIQTLKQLSIKQFQKVQAKKYYINKINNEIENILYSGQDIKEQLFVMMGALTNRQNNQISLEQNYCEEKENQRNVYEVLLGGNVKYHEQTKNLNINYTHKIRNHSTLLISEYNRLKFQQINLKKCIKQFQMYQKQMNEQKQRMISNKIKARETDSGFFATALPEKDIKPKTTTRSKNFRKTKICKGNILSKGPSVANID